MFPKPEKKKKEPKPLKRSVKPIKQKAYKPTFSYASIFTKDLDRCYITGFDKSMADIHIHHIFDAANKANSEKYHFIVPLRADYHNMSDHGIHFDREMDLRFKKKCQDYWLKHYGTKEEFIAVFGKWWE